MISNSAERRQRIKEQSKEVANYMNHIEPPPELYKQWEGMTRSLAFEAAYRAGANEELEACIKLLSDLGGDGEMIRRYRRPKPPRS